MLKCPQCGEEIQLPKRALFEKVRAWLEVFTFLSALGVLGVMLWNSFQTRESINLTRESVSKIDTGFALTRQQINLQTQQNEVMREELNLSKTSVGVQQSQYEASTKESMESNRPRIVIESPKVIFSDSGLQINTTITNTGFSDAENIRLSGERKFPIKERYVVVAYSKGIPETTRVTPENFSSIPDILPLLPKKSVPFDSKLRKITKNRPTVVEEFVPSAYTGDFYSVMIVTYTWYRYNENYTDTLFYEHIFHQKDSTFSTKLIDMRLSEPLMK
jgi:hypothetical protein